MSQRVSGYVRKERDCYETPAWVTQALVPHIPERIHNIWEPAAGSGKMVRALREAGYSVVGTDIADGEDFLMRTGPICTDAIITNPPYVLAQEFIERAIKLMFAGGGVVAMLLRTDFDHAKSRLHLFSDPSARFAKKVVLTKRIKWFEESTGQPSFNHAWFIWDWTTVTEPTLAYGP